MADAMVQKKKFSVSKSEDELLQYEDMEIDKPSSDKKESVGKGKGPKNSSSSKPQGKTSAGSKTSSGTKRKTYTPKAGTSKDSDLNNDDVLTC